MSLLPDEPRHSTFKAYYIYILAAHCSRVAIGPRPVLYNSTVIVRQLVAAEKCEFCYDCGIGINHGKLYPRLLI